MRPLLKILQSLLALALAMYFSSLWITRNLAYYINQRFFLLILLAVILLSLASAVVFASQVAGTESGKKGRQKWIVVYFLPIVTILLGLSQFFAVIIYTLIFILGVTRVSVNEEPQELSFWKHHQGLISGFVVMSIPLLIGIFTPQKPLSTETIDTRGINYQLSYQGNSPSRAVTLQEREDDNLDWMGILTTSDTAQLQGQYVHLSGFVYHQNGPANDQFMLGRYVVTCCVADAFAVGINVEWPQSAGLANNQWVEISGVIDIVDASGQTPIHIVADQVEKIEPLQQPYIYP